MGFRRVSLARQIARLARHARSTFSATPPSARPNVNSIADYGKTIDELLATLDHDNHALAVEIASLPEHIRGYGHVKERHLAAALTREQQLMAAWRQPQLRGVAA